MSNRSLQTDPWPMANHQVVLAGLLAVAIAARSEDVADLAREMAEDYVGFAEMAEWEVNEAKAAALSVVGEGA
jgi:hypothetical protein